MSKRIRLFYTIPALLTFVTGLTTFVGLLLIPSIAPLLLRWGMVIGSFALLAGIINLMRVHLNRATKERNLYSLILVLAMWGVFLIGALDSIANSPITLSQIFQYVIAPLEAAFAALLAFVLLIAGGRLFRQKTVWSLLFMFAAVFTLISTLPFTFLGSTLANARVLFEATVVTAGVRGLLLGVAIGTVLVSIRLLFGVDQPYRQ
jgi:hypothetical protein